MSMRHVIQIIEFIFLFISFLFLLLRPSMIDVYYLNVKCEERLILLGTMIRKCLLADSQIGGYCTSQCSLAWARLLFFYTEQYTSIRAGHLAFN